MEQQQQLPGMHWSWLNLLDLSRNLTKPYVEASQERERIDLGYAQAKANAMNAYSLLNLAFQNNRAAQQAELAKDNAPSFTEENGIFNDTMDALRAIPKSTDYNTRFYSVLGNTRIEDPRIVAGALTAVLKNKNGLALGTVRITRTDSGQARVAFVPTKDGKDFYDILSDKNEKAGPAFSNFVLENIDTLSSSWNEYIDAESKKTTASVSNIVGESQDAQATTLNNFLNMIDGIGR